MRTIIIAALCLVACSNGDGGTPVTGSPALTSAPTPVAQAAPAPKPKPVAVPTTPTCPEGTIPAGATAPGTCLSYVPAPFIDPVQNELDAPYPVNGKCPEGYDTTATVKWCVRTG